MGGVSISEKEKGSLCVKIPLIESPILSRPSFWLCFRINMDYFTMDLAISFDYFSRYVCGRIINSNYFIIGVVLFKQADQAFFNVSFLISGGQNYAYHWANGVRTTVSNGLQFWYLPN